MSNIALVLLAFAQLAAAPGAAVLAETREALEFEVPPPAPRKAECAIENRAGLADPRPVFELMKTGSAQAVACAEFLEEHHPGWHSAAGADQLVAPFVTYLLGDGTARGLERHQIFIDLLGHLERIAPDWRLRASVEALLPQIILGSVVEDPFVANVWSTALPEIDQEWRESDAAQSVVPELYRRAVLEEREVTGTLNLRPRMALKEISWLSYARLQLATRAFDSWPKRAAAVAAISLILVLATLVIRRRKKT